MTKNLNRGLEMAQGEFIARMDSDDISLPERFEKQLTVLQSQPDIVLCGTAIIQINEQGVPLSIGGGPRESQVLRWYSIFRPAIAHPTAMFRAVLLKEGIRYNERFKVAQDYELWSRMQVYGRATVLQTPLLKYRVHSQNISNAKKSEQARTGAEICANNMKQSFPAYFQKQGDSERHLLADFLYRETPLTHAQVRRAVELMTSLERSYLDSLGPVDKKTRSAVQRLTVRWILQAVFQKRSTSLAGKLLVLYSILPYGSRIVEESIFFARRRTRARSIP